jgi:hypothetical protein
MSSFLGQKTFTSSSDSTGQVFTYQHQFFPLPFTVLWRRSQVFPLKLKAVYYGQLPPLSGLSLHQYNSFICWVTH